MGPGYPMLPNVTERYFIKKAVIKTLLTSYVIRIFQKSIFGEHEKALHSWAIFIFVYRTNTLLYPPLEYQPAVHKGRIKKRDT